jgi:hypothetical protein
LPAGISPTVRRLLADRGQITDQAAQLRFGNRRPCRLAEARAPTGSVLEDNWFPGGEGYLHGVETTSAAAASVFADGMMFDPNCRLGLVDAAGAMAANNEGGEVFSDGTDAGPWSAADLRANDDRWSI